MSDAGSELVRELIAYCKEHLADVKSPRSIDFRPELPRHPTGKLYKRLLKDEYWAEAGRTIQAVGGGWPSRTCRTLSIRRATETGLPARGTPAARLHSASLTGGAHHATQNTPIHASPTRHPD